MRDVMDTDPMILDDGWYDLLDTWAREALEEANIPVPDELKNSQE